MRIGAIAGDELGFRDVEALRDRVALRARDERAERVHPVLALLLARQILFLLTDLHRIGLVHVENACETHSRSRGWLNAAKPAAHRLIEALFALLVLRQVHQQGAEARIGLGRLRLLTWLLLAVRERRARGSARGLICIRRGWRNGIAVGVEILSAADCR